MPLFHASYNVCARAASPPGVPFVSVAIVSALVATKIASLNGSSSSRRAVKSSNCPASTALSGLTRIDPRPMKTASVGLSGTTVPSISSIVAAPAFSVTFSTWTGAAAAMAGTTKQRTSAMRA